MIYIASIKLNLKLLLYSIRKTQIFLLVNKKFTVLVKY